MATESQIDNVRRRLYPLVGRTLTRLADAELLLAHRARAAPTSAEAEAHAKCYEARKDLERWLCEAGELVGAPFNAEVRMPIAQ